LEQPVVALAVDRLATILGPYQLDQVRRPGQAAHVGGEDPGHRATRSPVAARGSPRAAPAWGWPWPAGVPRSPRPTMRDDPAARRSRAAAAAPPVPPARSRARSDPRGSS